ncbi:MAG: preprotein translocase subunit SecE [Clostridia bacterium]|jgi:preprotein translocase subunit SecE|nr:preprotein translocase subunit SecE [Clostridia bacterium]
MSEKKVVKTEKPGFFSRAFTWIKNLPGNISAKFRNMVAELKKVSWPTREDLMNYSLVVIVFVVALALIVGLLDTASSFLVRQLIRL